MLNDHGLDLDSGSSTFTSTENVSQPCLAEENVFATFAMETPLVLQKLALQTKRTCDTCSQQQDTAVPGEHKDIYRSNKNTFKPNQRSRRAHAAMGFSISDRYMGSKLYQQSMRNTVIKTVNWFYLFVFSVLPASPPPYLIKYT